MNPKKIATWNSGKAFVFGTLLAALPGVALAAPPSMKQVIQSSQSLPNATVYIDADLLRSTASDSATAAELSPQVKEVRIASALDFSTLQAKWEIGYASLKSTPPNETIASLFKGYIDEVAGKKIVWTPNQTYLIPLPDDVMAIVRPTDRKLVGQWLRKDRPVNPTGVLLEFADQPTVDCALMISIDVADVLSPSALENRLFTFESVSEKERTSFSRELSKLVGIQLTYNGDAKFTATFRFEDSPVKLFSAAKPILKEMLIRNGIFFKEFDQWEISVEGKDLIASGKIATSALDDLISLFSVHRMVSNASERTEDIKQTSNSDVAETSKAYLSKVTNIVARVRDHSASNTGERAQWNGNMARKIDDLPTLNVDPELVAFSTEVSKSLRNNAVTMQMANIKTGTASVVNNAAGGAQVYGYESSYGYGYGYYYDPNAYAKYATVGQSAGNANFKQTIAVIEQSLAEMRKKMTDKYKIQF